MCTLSGFSVSTSVFYSKSNKTKKGFKLKNIRQPNMDIVDAHSRNFVFPISFSINRARHQKYIYISNSMHPYYVFLRRDVVDGPIYNNLLPSFQNTDPSESPLNMNSIDLPVGFRNNSYHLLSSEESISKK